MTPEYILNREQLIHDFSKMRNNLTSCKLHYALKANAQDEVLQIFKEENANFEIASQEEFDKLINIGVNSGKIICGLPIKKETMISNLYSRGCNYFVFDSIEEYNKLCKNAEQSIKILRININDIYKDNIDYGMEMEEVDYFFNFCGFKDDLYGLSFHLSNNTDIDLLLEVLDKMQFIIDYYKISPKILNIGGNYRLDIDNSFYYRLNEKLQYMKNKYNMIVYAEPGEGIIAKAFQLHFSVVAVKKKSYYSEVFIDSGIASGLRRLPKKVSLINKEKENSDMHFYKFYDITCLHKCLFSMALPYELESADELTIDNYGAYTICYANSFHAWKQPSIKVI